MNVHIGFWFYSKFLTLFLVPNLSVAYCEEWIYKFSKESLTKVDFLSICHFYFSLLSLEKREQVLIFYSCCYFNCFFLVFLCVPLLCFRTMVTTAIIPILVLCLAQNVQVILGAPLKKCLEDGKILTLPDSTCQSIAVECGVRYFLIKFFYIWYKCIPRCFNFMEISTLFKITS